MIVQPEPDLLNLGAYACEIREGGISSSVVHLDRQVLLETNNMIEEVG